MAAGRLLYGLGSGSLSVAVSTAIAKWFRGPRLSFLVRGQPDPPAAGLPGGPRPGRPGPRGCTPGGGPPLLLALGIGAVALASGLVYGILERRAAARYDLGGQPVGGALRWGLLRFNGAYWLVVLLCVTYYSGIFPFQTFAQKYLIEAHRLSAARASMLVGIPTLIAMAASPVFGLLADRIGHRSQLMAIGTLLLLPIYLMMAYTRLDPAVAMVLMGLSFALVPAVMWPSVMLVVPPGQLGTSFGLMQMVQSFGLVGFNCMVGWANDACGAGEAHPDGYRLGMWLFTATVAAGLAISLVLRNRERGPRGHGLETPSGRLSARSVKA